MTTTQARPGTSPSLTEDDAPRTHQPGLVRRGVWAGLAVSGTVLLVWTGLGFHSGWGRLVDALAAVVLGWSLAALAAGVLLLLGRLVRVLPAGPRAVGASAAVVIGLMGMWTALWFGPLVAGVVLAGGAAALFALWHVSPTSVRGSAVQLVTAAAFLGLLYGWIAFRTGSIRYTIPAHIAVNAMGLSFALLLLGH